MANSSYRSTKKSNKSGIDLFDAELYPELSDLYGPEASIDPDDYYGAEPSLMPGDLYGPGGSYRGSKKKKSQGSAKRRSSSKSGASSSQSARTKGSSSRSHQSADGGTKRSSSGSHQNADGRTKSSSAKNSSVKKAGNTGGARASLHRAPEAGEAQLQESSYRGSGKSTAARKYNPGNDTKTVLKLLVLVAVVLVLFEGRLVHTMFTQHSQSGIQVVEAGKESAGGKSSDVTSAGAQNSPEENVEEAEPETAPDTSTAVTAPSAPAGSLTDPDMEEEANDGTGIILAGFSSDEDADGAGNGTQTDASAGKTSSEGSEDTAPVVEAGSDSTAVVPWQSVAKDDSFFADSVFIGDSRMEGFRNSSGITQGDFLTAVGLCIDDLTGTKVATPEGEITVYQGLSGKQYNKIYMMLGTNDLGFYPWEMFLPKVEATLKQFHELQPGAEIYVCSVIYVDETLTSYDYVNNQNVDIINGYLLQACEDLDYCHYLNLNELFDNGYHSLITGASQDGVHLYAEYLQQMLEYLKNHYLDEDTGTAEAAQTPASAATAAEPATEASDTGMLT